jgi:hypothetical protein
MDRAIAGLVRKARQRGIARIERAGNDDQVARQRIIGNLGKRIGVVAAVIPGGKDDDDSCRRRPAKCRAQG